MTKKGKISEIFSKALHYDEPRLYSVGYLDFEIVKEVSLPEFVNISQNFEIIPATRIVFIKKGNNILYSKNLDKKDT